MTQQRRRRGPAQNEVDTAWKLVLHELFADFLALVHHELHRAIDWARPPEFLDKEIQAVARRAATGRRYVDVLVKVWLRDGQEQWLLIHVEVQAQPQDDFAERMYSYHALLFLRYRRPVVSLAVLIDRRPDWRPGTYGYAQWGCAAQFHYPVVKLLDWRGQEEELLRRDNPFAQVALAQLAMLTDGRDVATLAEVRRAILRRLVRAGYGEARIIAVLRFLDWILGLPDDLAAQIDAEVAAEEGMTVTQLLTPWEQRVWTRGQLEGRQEGRQDFLLQLMARRWPPLDDALRAQVAALSAEQMLALGEALFEFRTREDLDRWLARHAAQASDTAHG